VTFNFGLKYTKCNFALKDTDENVIGIQYFLKIHFVTANIVLKLNQRERAIVSINFIGHLNISE